MKYMGPELRRNCTIILNKWNNEMIAQLYCVNCHHRQLIYRRSNFGFLQVIFCDNSCHKRKVQRVWTISYIG